MFFVVACLPVYLFVCLSVSNFGQTDLHDILWTVGNGPTNKRLNFGGDPNHVWKQGLFSGFVTIGRYGKWYQPTALCDAAVQAGLYWLMGQGVQPPPPHTTADTPAYGFKCFEGVHYVAFRVRFFQ